MDMKEQRMDFKSIMKEAEFLGKNDIQSCMKKLACATHLEKVPVHAVLKLLSFLCQSSLVYIIRKAFKCIIIKIAFRCQHIFFFLRLWHLPYPGSAHMTWKEKKELENKRVVALGGKPQKKQRLPLSVARVMMKKQKEREEKMQEENLVLGRFGGASSSRKAAGRRRPEDRVLKSTEGNFRNGVLDVKQLLKPSAPKASFDDGKKPFSSGKGKKKKKGGKKNKGKKNKGGGPGKKRH